MIYDDDTSLHHHFAIDPGDRPSEPGRVRRPPLRIRKRILELARMFATSSRGAILDRLTRRDNSARVAASLRKTKEEAPRDAPHRRTASRP
jgi:hypothetical protein